MGRIKKEGADIGKKSNRFRCQYQFGKLCISETFESDSPISSAQIILTLTQLAIKVKEKKNAEAGGRVALNVLIIHEFIMKNVHDHNCIGTGKSKSFYFNPSSKSKKQKSERVDLEFRGEYGIVDSLVPLNRYIEKYREYKKWDNNVNFRILQQKALPQE